MLHGNQVFQIRNKCVFLIQAYQIALEKMGINNTRWKKDCCQEAVRQLNDIGFNTTINPNTVMNWNIDFRKEEKFHHPNFYVANNIKPKPVRHRRRRCRLGPLPVQWPSPPLPLPPQRAQATVLRAPTPHQAAQCDCSKAGLGELFL
jgi:hypothetical protein